LLFPNSGILGVVDWGFRSVVVENAILINGGVYASALLVCSFSINRLKAIFTKGQELIDEECLGC
jgi:hypothetical protein